MVSGTIPPVRILAELHAESLDSLYNFFKECRGIMRKFPVGKLKEYKQKHLGVLINRILNDVFRPFLEKWSGPFRAWWVLDGFQL